MWQQVILSDVSLGTRLRDSLVADEDVKTNKQNQERCSVCMSVCGYEDHLGANDKIKVEAMRSRTFNSSKEQNLLTNEHVKRHTEMASAIISCYAYVVGRTIGGGKGNNF